MSTLSPNLLAFLSTCPATDASQNAALALLENPKEITHPRAYFRRAALNAIISEARARRPEADPDHLVERGPTPEEIARDREMLELTLDALSLDDVMILLGEHGDDAALAASLGMTVGALQQRRHRLRQNMKR